jgi:hypothetical protein
VNENDRAVAALVDREYDRRLEEWNGDLRLVARAAIYDWYVACAGNSSGLHRAPPVVSSGFSPKPQVEAIDIPSAKSPEASSPS